MTKMTIKELSLLTQKQIKEYVQIAYPSLKVPKKWADKKSAVSWLEKNLNDAPTQKTAKGPKASPKKSTKVKAEKVKKPAKEKKPRGLGEAVTRRFLMVNDLVNDFLTADELSSKYGNKYKSVLDDLHAIRHNRAGQIYVNDKQILLAVNVGKSKVFTICLEKDQEKVAERIKASIEIAQ